MQSPQLALSLLLVCASCASYTPLEPAKVKALDLSLVGGGNTVCVNDPAARVRARAIYHNGTMVASWTGRGGVSGRLRLHELAIAAGPVHIGDQGDLQFPSPLAWIDRRIDIRAQVPSRTIAARLTLAPRYDCGGAAVFTAEQGESASSGGDGGDGADGPSLHVSIAQVNTKLNGRLILVRVTGQGRREHYLVDARGAAARFTVSADGGDGGEGGRGSSGSNGMSGRDGMSGSSGSSCRDGSDGTSGTDGEDGGRGEDGGDGGRGGRGGNITVEYAPGDDALVDLLAYAVDGGAGGSGGGGGSGGSGGSGGNGGAGGSAGSTTGTDSKHCSTSPGRAGSDGRDGSSGYSGSSGSSGTSGVSGAVVERQVDGAELWADEIAAGLDVVIGAGR